MKTSQIDKVGGIKPYLDATADLHNGRDCTAIVGLLTDVDEGKLHMYEAAELAGVAIPTMYDWKRRLREGKLFPRLEA